MEIKNIVESAATVTRVQTLHKGVIVFPLDGPELSLISSQMFRDLDSAERDARKSLALIIEKRGMLRSLITPNDNDDKENH